MTRSDVPALVKGVIQLLDIPWGIVQQLDPEREGLDSFHSKPEGPTEIFEWPHGMPASADGSDDEANFTFLCTKAAEVPGRRHRGADCFSEVATRSADLVQAPDYGPTGSESRIF